MSKPTTKKELIAAANEQFDKMWELIDGMTDAEQNMPFEFGLDAKETQAHWKRDKNIRDVLIHLYEWHQLLINWVQTNLSGNARPFLPEPYNWKTYGNMNVAFWHNHQQTPYLEAKALLQKSHQDVMQLIEGFTNEELYESKHFAWSGTTSVGSYCASTTASHYAWAITKLKKQIKKLRK